LSEFRPKRIIAAIDSGEISEWANRKRSVSEEQIRERAYEIYIERGGVDGQALDDWLRAEIELEKSRGTAASRRNKN
jgi:hypothetical protein